MNWTKAFVVRCPALLLAALLALHGSVSAADFSVVNGQPPPCEGDERTIPDAQVRTWGVERAAPRAVLAALSAHMPETQRLLSLSVGADGVMALVEAGAKPQGELTRLQDALQRSGLLPERATGVAVSGPTQLTLRADRAGLAIKPLMGRAAGCREVNAILIDFMQLSIFWTPDMQWRWLSREVFVEDGPARSLQRRFKARLTWSHLQRVLLGVEQAPYQMRLAEFYVQPQGDGFDVTGTLAVPFGKTSNAVRDAGFQPVTPGPAARAPLRNPFMPAALDPGRAGSDCERRARLWASTARKPVFSYARGSDEEPVAMIAVGDGFPLMVRRDGEIGETGARLLRVGSRSSDVDIEYAEMASTSPATCTFKRMTLSRTFP